LLHGQVCRLDPSEGVAGKRQPLSGFILKVGLPTLIGVFARLLGYLLGKWNVLGIKVDTTSLQGFVVLGILFSYVGIDLVLTALAQRKSDSETGNFSRQKTTNTSATEPQ